VVIRSILRLRLLCAAPSWRKMEMVGQMNEAGKTMMRSGLKERFPHDTPEKLQLEVLFRKQRRFDQMQLQRRQLQTVATDPERKAYVASAEDIILARLEWYRLGNEISDRQWRDILGVLEVQAGRLDFNYLHLWAQELNVADLLQRALKESE
jgi:hypothetical protein